MEQAEIDLLLECGEENEANNGMNDYLKQHSANYPPAKGHLSLWMRAQHSTASKPQTLPGCLRSHEQGIPKGFCVTFHRGVQCVPGCAFKHLCYKFEGLQKASQCNFRSQSKNTGKQSFLPSPNLQSLTLEKNPKIQCSFYLVLTWIL